MTMLLRLFILSLVLVLPQTVAAQSAPPAPGSDGVTVPRREARPPRAERPLTPRQEASRERWRKCGSEWRDLRAANRTEGQRWRDFRRECLARLRAERDA